MIREQTPCRQQMSRDLMKIYREVCQDVPLGTTQTEVYEMVVNHKAPRFYIDPRRAHLHIAPLTRGDYSKLQGLTPLKKQMYKDLFDVVMRLCQNSKFWHKKLYYILKEAVLEPAPRFYISSKRMEQIWKESTEVSRQARLKRIGKCV